MTLNRTFQQLNSAVMSELCFPAVIQCSSPFVPYLDPLCKSVYKVGLATTVHLTELDRY